AQPGSALVALRPYRGQVASTAFDVDAKGRVAGYVRTDGQAFRLVTWANASAAPVALRLPPGYTVSTGVITGLRLGPGQSLVGTLIGPEAPNGALAVWRTPTALPKISRLPGSERQLPESVSPSGLLVTRRLGGDGPTYTLWRIDGERATLSGPLSLPRPSNTRNARPRAVSDAGRITGVINLDSSRSRVAAWSSTGTQPHLLPSLAGRTNVPAAINDRGLVGGHAYDDTGGVAVVWRGDRVIDLNTLLPANTGYQLQSVRALSNTGYALCVATNPSKRSVQLVFRVP
ncbi:MAG TPA: hypothetical protein DCZ72_02890, partial [Armatimonadetes bacterium]|nr:hypothetical protein [Armatimonadota bacterium]